MDALAALFPAMSHATAGAAAPGWSRRSRVLAAALVPLMTAQIAAAQEQRDTVRLDDIVVTATRLATPASEAPGSVTVLTGESIRSSGHRFVADALRSVPGVSLAQSSGPGALTALFIRGGEADYVQVLVDGVQVNDPGGSYDWAHLRTENIERIEIVRGPSSVLYGSDAVSGVVQIFTRAGGRPRIEGGVTSSRGDRHDASDPYDTHAFDASVTGRSSIGIGDGISYGVTAAHATSTGLYAFNSDYDNTSISGRLRLDAARGDIGVSVRRTDSDYHYPTSGGGAVVDRNQFARGHSWSVGLDAGHRVARIAELRILGGVHSSVARTENPPDEEGDDRFWNTSEQLRRSVDARANVDLPRGMVFTAGAEREWQEAQTAFESIGAGGTFEDATDEERANTGVYVQLHGSPIRSLSLTLGGRIDDNDAFGTFSTGRAALSWLPAHGLRVHAAFGTAFKEPTFFENFATGFARGNPDLQPEHARSGEAGVEVTALKGLLSLGATWFDQRFRNLIQYTFNTPTPEDPNYYNVGAARARGAELTASVAGGRARVSAGYTYTSTRVTDDGFGDDLSFQEGLPMLRRPEHQASLDASFRIVSALTGNVGARWVGERDDLDFTDPMSFSGDRTTLDDYAVVDVGFRAALRRGLELSGGVRNLFDESYHEIHNFPAAGRVFHAGVRVGADL